MADVVPIAKHREYVRQTKRHAAGVLRDVRALHPTEILVIGTKPNGDYFVQGAPPDLGNALLLMEMGKRILLGEKA